MSTQLGLLEGTFGSLKDVSVYIKVQFNTNGGRAGIAYLYKGKWKTEYLLDVQETTPARIMILAAIHVMQSLKEPCNVTIYTLAAFGLKMAFKTKKNWVNRDLGNKLLHAIEQGGHEVKNISEFGEEDGEHLRVLNRLGYEITKRWNATNPQKGDINV